MILDSEVHTYVCITAHSVFSTVEYYVHTTHCVYTVAVNEKRSEKGCLLHYYKHVCTVGLNGGSQDRKTTAVWFTRNTQGLYIHCILHGSVCRV